MHLTERQERILSLIIRAYAARPEPVGSKLITEMGLNVSSATIRNEMSVLEELGFVASPHTSAGRIPTESGYRYFVRRLLDETELPEPERRAIAEEFSSGRGDLDNGLRLAVTTLARASQGAALVTRPQSAGAQFKHLELISTQGRLALAVLVLYGGGVRQQMLTLADPLTQDILSACAARLNMICDKLTGEQIRQKSRTLDTPLEREMMELVADTLSDADAPPMIAYRDGLTDVLREFTESDAAQQAVRLMEGQTLLPTITDGHFGEEIGGVQVVIGGDGQLPETRSLSIVLARYGVNNQVTGVLGVLGPTRMRYGRAIASVRYVAGLVSGLIDALYRDEPS